jgi:hypothetical protein
MKGIFTSTALVSVLLVAGVITTPSALAQDNQPCVGENCPAAPDMQGDQKRMKKGVDQDAQGTEDQTGQTPMRKKRIQGSTDEGDMQDGQQLPRKKRAGTQQDTDVDVDVNVGTQRSARRGDWKFDPGRHQRRKSKSVDFTFYYGGYWYPEPYWEVYTVRRGRVSCGEGRAIVAERFNRVRVVECNGTTYTYLGRLQGDTYRILLNARSARIVGRRPI